MKSSLIGDMARSFGLPKFKRAAGVVTRRLPIPQPLLLVGPGASARLGEAIADFGHRRVLLVTDPVVTKLGLLTPLTDALKARGTAFVVFDDIAPNAPLPQIERGIACFQAADCDAIVALGGGSEVTVAAVISDPENGTRLVIADTRLVPAIAALDPPPMTGLAEADTNYSVPRRMTQADCEALLRSVLHPAPAPAAEPKSVKPRRPRRKDSV